MINLNEFSQGNSLSFTEFIGRPLKPEDWVKPEPVMLRAVERDVVPAGIAGHGTINQALNAPVYFAIPYCSWERGLNENTNGLIRQYFPKGSSFEDITDEEVEKVMHRLNHRLRKGLNYRTPHSVFFEQPECKAA